MATSGSATATGRIICSTTKSRARRRIRSWSIHSAVLRRPLPERRLLAELEAEPVAAEVEAVAARAAVVLLVVAELRAAVLLAARLVLRLRPALRVPMVLPAR